MPKVLIATADSALVSELSRRIAKASVYAAPSSDAIFEHLRSTDLLIIDDCFVASTVDLVAELRAVSRDLLLIYCLDPAADARLVRRLILDLGVNELVFHPVNPDVLARRSASLLGVPYSGVPEPLPGAAPKDALARRLAEAWSRARDKMLARADVLDRVAVAWLDGTLDVSLREQAQREAHKLAGSLGTFGLGAGTRFARELEQALESQSLESEAQASMFATGVAALRLEIERAPAIQDAGQTPNKDWELPPALLISLDAELAARLQEEAVARHWVWQSAPDAAAARTALAELNPAAVLIDADAGGAGMLEFLSELAARTPPVTAIILTSNDSLMDRVEVARRGGRGFFLKGLPPVEIVGAAKGLLERLRPHAHVLAVDDDLAVLDALRVLLGSRGIRLTALSDPLALWDKLEGSPPDLLLLDIDMPQVSGIELCRVVRNDLRWAGIPVMFLTALNDPDTVRRVFAAGADDFVAKPIMAPELLTRIGNRLERTRLLRSMAEVDALTGLPNRLKCRHAITDFLRLADRHGQPMGLALLGVDGLGRINEECGPSTADEVLRQLGRCLREEFRSEEVAGRWGGNDFALGLYGLDRQASVRRLQDIASSFAGRVFTAPRASAEASELRVTLSGGVAGYPEDGSDLDSLLLEAGEARRRASAAGGNQLVAARAEHGDGPRRVDLVIVSCDEAAMSLLVHGIDSEGHRTRLLRSGFTAARALCGPERSLRARAVLIDADLPGLDSLGLVKQMASEGILQQTAVIVLTSASVGDNAVQVLEGGASDVIAKPVDLPVLLDRVRQELEWRRSPAANLR